MCFVLHASVNNFGKLLYKSINLPSYFSYVNVTFNKSKSLSRQFEYQTVKKFQFLSYFIHIT